MKNYPRTTEPWSVTCHMTFQHYLPPDTSKRAPPQP